MVSVSKRERLLPAYWMRGITGTGAGVGANPALIHPEIIIGKKSWRIVEKNST